MNKTFYVLAACACLLACAAEVKQTGADRDAFGCIASAGYTWSRVAGDCLRLWEAGVQLTNTQKPDAALAAYVVISADGSQAELFLPKQEAVLLSRTFTPDGPVWKKGGFRLERRPEGWRLFQQDELIYQAGNPPQPAR